MSDADSLRAGTTFDNRSARVDTLVQGQTAYSHSAIAEAGGTATVYNIDITNVTSLPKRWMRPIPPPVDNRIVERSEEMKAIIALLAELGAVSIGGKVATVGVQGMAGIGKTTLAKLVANALAESYADGVLWTDVGPNVRTADQAQPLLNIWAGHCVGPISHTELNHMVFDVAAVRSLLAEHPRLLVVLDNVWSLPAIAPLRSALPSDAHLLVTTRSRTIAKELGGGRFELDVLREKDALGLAEQRLEWTPDSDSDAAWVNDLIEDIGRHPLALDVALGILVREGDYPGEWRASAERILADVRSGRNLDQLKLDEEDREHNVEAVLAYSYTMLPELAQRHFRTLGAFAPDAIVSTEIVATVWECEVEAARRQLVEFANDAVLTRVDQHNWRQHRVLRGYALGWLRAVGEDGAAAARHADAYNAAMRSSSDDQCDHEMLPYMPQLRHAVFWAIDNDLDLALSLIADSGKLMAAFGLARENLTWIERAVALLQSVSRTDILARAYVVLGNTLSVIARLAEEDGRKRLYEALSAYDKALSDYRPDTMPLAYAAVQNNRANRFHELASLAHENRAQRLHNALAAYDESLSYYSIDANPFAYADVQNNRGNIYAELATLKTLDQRTYLCLAIDAYNDALSVRRDNIAPLDYAATQNNKGNRLYELSFLAGEDRHARLGEALIAFDEALRFRRSDVTPLDYAATQNNRGNALCALATAFGADRKRLLFEALAAYDEALLYRRPNLVPRDYAMSQYNRGLALSEIACLYGEDRSQRLHQALDALNEALRYRPAETVPLDYAATQNSIGNQYLELATVMGEDRRDCLYSALAAYNEALRFRRLDTAPLDYAMTQNNRANSLRKIAMLPGEDHGTQLHEALAAYDEALRFRHVDTTPLDYAMTQYNRAGLLSELATLPGENRRQRLYDALQIAWEALQIFIQLQHEQYANICAGMLRRLRSDCGKDFGELWKALDAGDPPPWLVDDIPVPASPLNIALQRYIDLRNQASESDELEHWSNLANVGEGLLNADWSMDSGLPADIGDQLRFDLADVYNSLGSFLRQKDALEPAMAAYKRAVVLQPDFAMWRRNLARTLITLGRLAEAATEIETARVMEPDAERLGELDAELAAAQASAAGEPYQTDESNTE